MMRKQMKQAVAVESSDPVALERSGRPTGSVAPSTDHGAPIRLAPDPEVPERPARRRFTAEYKLRIVEEVDALRNVPGAIGALLRREGLYSSHLTAWRALRDTGALHALAPKRRGRKPAEKNPLAKKVAQLEAQNRRLQKQLEKAELIIDVQKKVAALLGRPIEDLPETGSNE
jgi:transposase